MKCLAKLQFFTIQAKQLKSTCTVRGNKHKQDVVFIVLQILSI